MDDETRFWIAVCQVAHTKYTTSINPLFRNAKAIDGKRPVSDRASNFGERVDGLSQNDLLTIVYLN